MAIKPALTSTEKTRLKNSSTVRRYIQAVPSTQIATARINQASFTYPLAQLTVDNTSAGWSGIQVGMTVYVGSTLGGHEYGVYRVRKAPGASTLYIQELGGGDPGLLPVSLRGSGAYIADNAYITVLDRYDVWSVLPRIAYASPTSSTTYEDYDQAVGTNNSAPSPIVNMIINGTYGHYGKKIQDGETVGLTCAVSVTHWPTSSSETYSWSYPAAFTGVSGASTSTLTATAPAGNYTVHCTVTPNSGAAFTATRHILICGDTSNPPLQISGAPASDIRDRTGRRMTFTLADDDLSGIPDGAMLHYWEEATWGGDDVSTATRSFSGWILRNRMVAGNPREAQVELVGPAGLLGMLESTSQYVVANASPTTWQMVLPSLSSATFMAWYMLRWRAANILNLFNFTVYGTTATGQRLPAWKIDGGTLLSQIQALATQRGNFGAGSTGELFFLRHPSMVSYGSRSATVTRDTLTSDLYAPGVNIEERRYNQTQQVRGEGFSWDGSASVPTPYLSDAPSVPGQGGSPVKLDQQVVVDQAELNQLTGDFYAYTNNPYPVVSLTLPGNRDVYEPAEMYVVALTVPSTLMPSGVEFSKNCIPVSVTKRHNPDGTADIEMSMEAETAGVTGVYVPVPVPDTSVFAPDEGAIPPYDLPWPDIFPWPVEYEPPPIPDPGADPDNPDPDDTYPAICCTSSVAYRTFNRRAGSSTDWENVTPTLGSGYAIKQYMLDYSAAGRAGAFILASNGTDSKVFRTSDNWSSTVSWTEGAVVSGVYDKIECEKGASGRLKIYGANGTAWSHTFDFTVSDGGWTAFVPWSGTAANYSAGVGWAHGDFTHPSSGNNYRGAYIRKSLTSTSITSLSVTYDLSGLSGGVPTNVNNCLAFYTNVGTLTTIKFNAQTNGTDKVTSWSGSQSGVTSFSIDIASYYGGSTWAGSVLIKSITITGTGTNPFSGGGYTSQSGTRYSTDSGASWSSDEPVGDSPGPYGGFSLGYYNTATLATSTELLEKSTFTGSYSAATQGTTTGAQPVCVVNLWYKGGSLAEYNTDSTYPHYLLATDTLVASEALYLVKGTTKTAVTPSPSGKGVGVSDRCLSTWKGKHWIMLASAGGATYACATKNAGAAYTNTALSGAVSVRCRKFDPAGDEWIIARGASGVSLSQDGGLTWATCTGDASGTIIYAEIYG